MIVIIISEENHGLIGIATDFNSAVDFLIKEEWLDENFEVDCSANFVPLKKKFEDDFKNIISNFSIEKFNNVFDGAFYLNEQRVYKKGE